MASSSRRNRTPVLGERFENSQDCSNSAQSPKLYYAPFKEFVIFAIVVAFFISGLNFTSYPLRDGPMTIIGLVAGTTSYGGNEISLEELIDP